MLLLVCIIFVRINLKNCNVMFDKETYVQRRALLKKNIGSGVLLFLGNDERVTRERVRQIEAKAIRKLHSRKCLALLNGLIE